MTLISTLTRIYLPIIGFFAHRHAEYTFRPLKVHTGNIEITPHRIKVEKCVRCTPGTILFPRIHHNGECANVRQIGERIVTFVFLDIDYLAT